VIEPASVRQAAENLIVQHGLTGWTFEWDDTLTTVGRCFHKRKQITVSHHFLDSPVKVIANTLLHEVSHAIAGPNHGHDDHWYRIALKLGCTGTTCAEGAVRSGDKRYLLTCRTCKRTWKRHKLTYRFPLCPYCKKMLHIHDNHA
jgi:hypothetical protein